MHSEREARQLWCPIMTVLGQDEHGNIAPTCIASSCAMWRWAHSPDQPCEDCEDSGEIPGTDGIEECDACGGSGRRRAEARGFCGLSGRPVETAVYEADSGAEDGDG